MAPNISATWCPDGATYDKILQIMDEGEGPQFIFNVTIANHGGYDTGTIAEEDMMRIDMNGEESAEANEYVTAIARADADLAAFLAKLAQREEPIVVVLFGDHQPGFVEQLAPTGDSDEEPTVDDAQQRYVTPYMLWTNDEQLSRHVRHGGDTEPELFGRHNPEDGRFATQRVLRVPLCHEAIATGD